PRIVLSGGRWSSWLASTTVSGTFAMWRACFGNCAAAWTYGCEITDLCRLSGPPLCLLPVGSRLRPTMWTNAPRPRPFSSCVVADLLLLVPSCPERRASSQKDGEPSPPRGPRAAWVIGGRSPLRPQLAHATAELAAQQDAERDAVAVAHGCCNGLDVL